MGKKHHRFPEEPEEGLLLRLEPDRRVTKPLISDRLIIGVPAFLFGCVAAVLYNLLFG